MTIKGNQNERNISINKIVIERINIVQKISNAIREKGLSAKVIILPFTLLTQKCAKIEMGTRFEYYVTLREILSAKIRIIE